jgi:hypothetical protein
MTLGGESMSINTEWTYTDEQAEEYAAKTGMDPRPSETKNEIDETGAFI